MLFILGAAIIGGHNLLDGLHFPASSAIHAPWAILHDRGWITLSENFNLRTSYPVLPWIGVIVLGYCLGPWFVRPSNPMQRRRRLLCMGTGSLTGFFALRLMNTYGDASWVVHGDVVRTLMSFFNITKYPPSLLFLMLTLGLVLLLLLTFERLQHTKWIGILAIFGAAPMFSYLLHLYVLKLLYLGGSIVSGLNQGKYFGFDNVGSVWLTTMLLAAVLFVPVRWFAMFKARRRDIVFLKYF